MEDQNRGLDALKKWREEGGVAVRKTPLEKLQEQPTSLRKSITAFCWVCVGENKNDVTNCTSKSCPLYNVRPWQKKGEDNGED